SSLGVELDVTSSFERLLRIDAPRVLLGAARFRGTVSKDSKAADGREAHFVSIHGADLRGRRPGLRVVLETCALPAALGGDGLSAETSRRTCPTGYGGTAGPVQGTRLGRSRRSGGERQTLRARCVCGPRPFVGTSWNWR